MANQIDSASTGLIGTDLLLNFLCQLITANEPSCMQLIKQISQLDEVKETPWEALMHDKETGDIFALHKQSDERVDVQITVNPQKWAKNDWEKYGVDQSVESTSMSMRTLFLKTRSRQQCQVVVEGYSDEIPGMKPKTRFWYIKKGKSKLWVSQSELNSLANENHPIFDNLPYNSVYGHDGKRLLLAAKESGQPSNI